MVLDAQRGGGVALRVEVDHEHPLAELGQGGGELTVDVVLPTPPFWLATTITRVRAGRGMAGALPGAVPGQHGVLGGPGQRRGLVVEVGRGEGAQLGRGAHAARTLVRVPERSRATCFT